MRANLWAMVTASRALLAVTAAVFVGAGLFVGGCGKSDAQMAGDTARTFMSGMANDDRTLVLSQMTRLAREKMEDSAASPSDKNPLGKDGYTVGEATIDGESASVPVTVTEANDGTNGDGDEAAPAATTVTEVGTTHESAAKETRATTQTIVLKMRREDKQWKVWAMRVPLAPGGPNITMDFEHPEAIIGETFKGIGEGIGAAMKGLGEGMGAMLQGMAKGMTEGAKAAEKGAKSANEIAEKAVDSSEHETEKPAGK